MIWFVRVLLFLLEPWQNTWLRSDFMCQCSFHSKFIKLFFLFGFNICIFLQDDPKVHAVVEKLLDVLNTPSEAVQRAVSFCLSPLMQSKKV